MQTATDIEIVPSGAALGAEIRGIDLSRPMDDRQFDEIVRIFGEHSVICFRGQDLTPEQMKDFCNRFAEPQKLYMTHYAMPAHPDILYISNLREDGRVIGYADAGSVWHTDGSFERQPPWATILHAREIPVTEDGRVLGDTLFASAVAAYDELDDATKASLQGLRVRHDVAGRRRKTGTATEEDNAKYEAKEKVVHPLVRTHPFTGRKLLYVSDGECDRIEGMDDDEALALIARLQRQIVREDRLYRHRWQVGDVLIWDNCAVQHLAIHDYHNFNPPLRRHMWRITVGHTDVYE